MIGRPGRVGRRVRTARFTPRAENLEDRCLLAGPVLDAIAPASVPAGKSLIIPVTASDADGDSLTYSASSGGAAVQVTLHTGNPFLKISAAGYGDMIFELFQDVAPNAVSKIVGLVNSGFYNGLTFHRIAPNFVIQGGDPNGNGSGGPGFQFDDELSREALFSGDGQLAMANSGPDTNGSQFFVTNGPQRFLDLRYTLFGQLVRGFDVERAINAAPNSGAPNNTATPPVTITNAAIIQNTTDAVLTLDAGASGSAPITVQVDDGHGGIVSQTFQATVVADTVDDPPFLGPVGNQSTTTNTAITIALTSIDIQNRAVSYAAAITDSVKNATFSVSGNLLTVTPNKDFRGVVHLITGVQRANGGSSFDSQKFTLTVSDQVLSLQAVNLTGVAGSTLGDGTKVKVGSFSPSFSAPSTSFSATIDWGDGKSATSGTILPNGSGGFDVFGTKAYSRFGSYPVSVTVRDTHAGVNQVAIATATISDAPLAVSSTAPSIASPDVSGVLATVSSGNPFELLGDLSATIDWGDGSSSSGNIIAQGGGFAISGKRTYAVAGDYSVRVTVSTRGGQSSSSQQIVAVPNIPPVFQGVPSSISVNEGGAIDFPVVASTPFLGEVVTYRLADGAPAGATIDPATGHFRWVPAVAASYNLAIVATASGPANNATSVAFSIAVINVPPVLSLGEDRSILAGGLLETTGRFSDPGSETWSGTVDYGDGSGTAPVSLNADKTIPLSHRFLTAGDFTVTVKVTDSSGGSGSSVFLVHVAAPLVVIQSPPKFVGKKGIVSSVVVHFSGPIDKVSAMTMSNYRLVSTGRDRTYGSRGSTITLFRSASYDTTSNTVTLTPRGKLSLKKTLQFQMSGLKDTRGRLIDATRSGKSGGTFMALVAKKDITA
ncbi:MAG: peptidyl-prolyl cis-trans isomerase [Planctomycetota bacterium]|nr:peptidyl-prolyl cis-trans isomerase [Planctomycetota bacterium]